jgi:hypothetical protein
MGLMQGKVQGDTFIVIDSFALPVEGTETRVNAQVGGCVWGRAEGRCLLGDRACRRPLRTAALPVEGTETRVNAQVGLLGWLGPAWAVE